MKIVIGIGNPYRRDDGVGPALAERLAKLVMSDVDVQILDGEPHRPAGRLDRRPARDRVDAVLSRPARPGQIHRTNLNELAGTSATISHGLGVPEAVELGRALDRLPEHLIVYAVEAADIGYGTELSPQVAAAIPELLDAVLTDLERAADHGTWSRIRKWRGVD